MSDVYLDIPTEKNSSLTLDVNPTVSTNHSLPRTVKHILPLQFGEQYANTSVRGMLNLYLQASSGLSSDDARTQVHLVGGVIYAAPLLGGLVADLGIGSFYGAVLFSILLITGMVGLSTSSANGLLGSYPDLPVGVTLIMLMILSIGIGGIKPCLTALASHQIEKEVKKEDEINTLDYYFKLNFVIANVGILAASLLTPVLSQISCLNNRYCYPLGFGMASLVLVLTSIIFYWGWRRYIKFYTARSQNSLKWKELISNRQAVVDIKRLLNFFVMCLPLSFFWMLYDQGMTAWQDQYESMNKLGFGFELSTELMANAGSILLLFWIPVLTKVVDPLLYKTFNFKLTGIPRMVTGFTILIAAFALSCLLQSQIETRLTLDTTTVTRLGNRVTTCDGCLSGLWQLPQWSLQALGEALVGTATPQFAYCQGGDRFRVLGPGLLFLTNSFGNLLVFSLDSWFLHGLPYLPRMTYYLLLATLANLAFVIMYLGWYRRVQHSPH